MELVRETQCVDSYNRERSLRVWWDGAAYWLEDMVDPDHLIRLSGETDDDIEGVLDPSLELCY